MLPLITIVREGLRDSIRGGCSEPASRRQRQKQRGYQDWARRQWRECGGKRFALTTDNTGYGTYTAMTVTNLQSLASSSTAGWQSARVSNVVTLALDYEILVDLSTAASSPANDKTAYVYLVPWVTTDGGTTWISGGNFGTTTLPTGSEATATITNPPSGMKGPVSIQYNATSQRLEAWFTVCQLCGGNVVPDGWSVAIRNFTGAALGTGCVVAYRAITETNQ